MIHLLLNRKSLALCLTVLSISASSYAQKIAAPEPIPEPSGTEIRCRIGQKFLPIQLDVSFAFRSSSDAQEVVEAALKVSGFLPGSVTAKAALVPNAEACRGSDSNFYILVNPRWFVRLYNDGGNEYWVDRAIIAHELGHIKHNHFITALGSNPTIELEADEFAGEVLARFGADLDQAKAPFRSDRLKPPHGSGPKSHPEIDDRLKAVERGWRRVSAASDWIVGAPRPNSPHVIASATKGTWIPEEGYTFLNDTPGDFRVRWDSGSVHPSHPHVLACKEEGRWCLEGGYDWLTSASNDFRVVWKPGKPHPTAPNIVASKNEGKWTADDGYEFVNDVAGDWSVKWTPGKSLPGSPHVIACEAERRWCTEPGYDFLNDKAGDFRVQWSRGKRHPTSPNISACADVDRWCADPGYDFINDVAGDFRVRWTQGKAHPTAPNVSACSKEGSWCLDDGYEWVSPNDPNDLRVRRKNP